MLHLMALVLAAAQTLTTGQTGITSPAGSTVKGQPATFDLSGFRLGLSEAEVEQVLRARGMTVRRRTRAVTFEDNVRGLVNIRGGKLPLKGGSVLASAEFDDGKGGNVMIQMLPWSNGARVSSVAYLPPAGTDQAIWRTILVEKFGAPARDSERVNGQELHAVWCGHPSCSGRGDTFRLVVDVNAQGGQIVLSQPDGTTLMLGKAVEEEAARMMPRGVPAL